MFKSIRAVAVLFILAALLLATGSPVVEVSHGSWPVGRLTNPRCGGELFGSGWLDGDQYWPDQGVGDLGVSPGTAVTGFPPGSVGGTIHAGDAHAAAAQADNTVAFGFLDQPCDVTYVGVQDLALVSPLVPGVYCATAFTLSANLVLTGSGVWIFKSESTLITSSGSSVTGGNSCDVWWRLGSSATLGTATAFTGNILALTSIGLADGASLNGRALAQTGAVTLDNNAISTTCAPPTAVELLDFGASSNGQSVWLLVLVALVVGGLGALAFGLSVRAHGPTEH